MQMSNLNVILRSGILTLATVVSLALAVCAGLFLVAPGIALATTLTPEEAAAWQADLDYLATELPVNHYDAYHAISERVFQDLAADLRGRIPGLDREQVIAGLCQLVALVGDSHTTLNIFSTDVRFYPFQLASFADGWRVLATSPDLEQALGCTPVAVDRIPLTEVEAEVRTAFCFSNDSGARAQLPNLLIIGPLLYGLGVAADPLQATWTFRGEDGTEFDLNVAAMKPGSTQGWPTVWDGRERITPMYRQQPGNPYYYIWNPDLGLLYFQYNACRERDDLSFADFSNMLMEAVNEYPFTKFVVDLRLNSGGNSGIADPLIDVLAADERVNQPGRLFVIIGRHTYSSAILNALSLKEKTAAILVGEPSGGRPNHYGEVRQLTLPNSGLTVSYSTKYFQFVAGDDDAIYPDIATPLSYAEFLAGADPALEAALAY